MQVWSVLHAARWNTGRKNYAKNRHLSTIAQCCRAIYSQVWYRMYRQSEKLLKRHYLFHIHSQYGELRPTNGWDMLARLGHPSKFQRVSRIDFVTAPTSLNGRQPNFAGCLVVSWAGILYTLSGALAPNGILPSAKFTLRPSLALSYIGSVTALHSSSGRQPKFAAWYKEWNYGTFADGATYIFRRVAITLGIGHILVIII